MRRYFHSTQLISLAGLLCLVACIAMPGAQAQTPANPIPAQAGPSAAPSLLPEVFAGWKQTASQAGRDATKADPANAALLKELGFTDEERAEYRRGSRYIKVTAVRFADSGGALGAFTFYREPAAIQEDVGDEAASLSGLTVLFRQGNIVVEARFDELTAMTASQLRELATELPRPQGTAAGMPSLPSYLPKESQMKNSARYLVGPIGLAKAGAASLAQLVDFSRSPELMAAQYNLDGRKEDLLVISYPTPQIAAERQRAFEGASQQPQLYARRTGPLLAIARGEASERQARSLIGAVNYDASVTWNEPTFLGKHENLGLLILGVFALIGILLVIALITGVAFGGMRVMVARLLGRKVERSDEMEIIRLKIGESR